MALHSVSHDFTSGVRQALGPSVSIQVTIVPFRTRLASPEIFISEALSTGDKWKAFTMFSIDGFPYLLWFG